MDSTESGVMGVSDPERFAELPGTFLWTESFVISEKISWAEEHAEEVYQAKLSTGLSFNKLVERFGKSRPTIKHAWDIAVERRRTEAAGLGLTEPADRDAL